MTSSTTPAPAGADAVDDVIDGAALDQQPPINLAQSEPGSSVKTIDESHRLRFAAWVLGCLFGLVLVVFACYAIWPDNDAIKQIFEFVKVGALPLVTLVIGFYFPSTGGSSSN